MTVEAAAGKASIHPRHWQKIEVGSVNLTLRTISKIAEALDVDEVELLRPVVDS